VDEALHILRFTNKKPAKILYRVLYSAISNAENNASMDVDKLFVKRVQVDEGPMWKRIKPRAMGRATRILKRTSHITVIVDEP
jgi:large subunit ribosomal protein L22